MYRTANIAILGGAIALAACATGDGGYEVAATDNPVSDAALVAPPADLAGTVIRAASADGSVVNRVHFYPDGMIHIVPEDGNAAIQGTYAVRNNQLCLDWAPRGTECWPYERAFQMGETVTLTSDRGQMARVTLLDDDGRLATGPVQPAPRATTAPRSAPMSAPAAVETRRAGERG